MDHFFIKTEPEQYILEIKRRQELKNLGISTMPMPILTTQGTNDS